MSNLPVMRSASKVNGILFILMLVGMVIYSLPSIYKFSKTQTQAQSWELFTDGELLRQFEVFYDKRLFLRDFSVRQWANLSFLLFGEGTSGVLLGKEGWLFSSQEAIVPNSLASNIDRQMEKIAQVKAQLEASGKRLIMLPVPMKMDIYREYTQTGLRPQVDDLYQAFVTRLEQQQIAVCNLRAAFVAARDNQNLYVRTDTHWSPAGARLAAQTLAGQYPELMGDSAFESDLVEEKELKGDLLNFVNFAPELQPQYFASVTIPLYETVDKGQSDDAMGLFEETSQSLMLIGTSYSRVDDWNFPGFLKEALHKDLMMMAQQAQGPFAPMEEFIESSSFSSPDVETVIWEFPVRTLLALGPSLESGN
ncbi:alginate O-acetyltransferase AlgX-related protein [Marinobacterium lutimaris]|uniref:Alginate O-acetyltransferase complex protein AlgJ n=1 Tax=Marinobacterium lutimaris TaxID=568106 RepID=A0A1H6CWE0_9GAMM|nr:hypothetical protein [Marinobacterium lutimaris]SEG77137.1 alginate O-acetyltransferase complex protein AlgJ [Marinobacterium lutimaris]